MNKNRKKHTPPISKPVPTLNLVDYSEMKMPVVVVYDSPLGFSGKSHCKSVGGIGQQANKCVLPV